MAGEGTVLEKILIKKRGEVQALKRTDVAELKKQALGAPPARDFLSALRGCTHVPIIAEIKKASPSAGNLRSDVDVAAWARTYEAAGAAALSVLTDGPFFGGHLQDLAEARGAVNLPALRKDFIIDPVQLYQSRAAGADAVLLIIAALEPDQLVELFEEAQSLGLTVLVEVHKEDELEPALALDPPLLGINNRNLKTLDVSLDTCLALRPRVNNGALVVGESGIKGPEDVARLRSGGLDAFLIGTTLMKTDHPAEMLQSLCRAGD